MIRDSFARLNCSIGSLLALSAIHIHLPHPYSKDIFVRQLCSLAQMKVRLACLTVRLECFVYWANVKDEQKLLERLRFFSLQNRFCIVKENQIHLLVFIVA